MRWEREWWSGLAAGAFLVVAALSGCAPAARSGASGVSTAASATPGLAAHASVEPRAQASIALVPGSWPAATGPAASAATGPAASAAPALSAWTGGIDLYRSGVFATQKTWLWCTAADIQITRNIVLRRTDHTAASQRTYFSWMRAHNRYTLPLSAGVDAQGWAAGFAHYVDSRYRLHVQSTFSAALRSAVINLRKTNLPVGITVDHGNHAWLITGFTATADPAATSTFTITSVRVVGPLWGLQSKNGYDMRPDTRLTPAQLAHYFTPWWYAPTRMVWDHKFISVQP